MQMQDYFYINNKPTYYRVKENLKVEYIEPSFVFEMIYFNNEKLLENELVACAKEKEKKISRMANLKLEEIESRLFRSLVNRDKYHTLSLAHELYLRDKKSFFNIMYKLSFLSEDENKLIKTYMFELMMQNMEYSPYILKNLIHYFIKSNPKYMDFEDEEQLVYFSNNVSDLYIEIYNRKKEYEIKALKLKSGKKLTEVKKYILEKIK